MDQTMLRSKRPGFTLVELLVVIGIIAVLIGILLPTLNRARQSSAAASCGSNLSQMVKASFVYTASNKGLFPVGYAPMGFNTVVTRTANGNTYSFTGSYKGWMAWFTALNNATVGGRGAPPYVSNDDDPIYKMPVVPGGRSYGIPYKLGKGFQCAAVRGTEFTQQVHYYHNPGVFIHPIMEMKTASSPQALFIVGGRRVQAIPLQQRKESEVLPETALFWDTPLLAGTGSDFTSPLFADTGFEGAGGEAVLRASMIDSWDSPDSGRLASPQSTGFTTTTGGIINPALRFRFAGRDHTAALTGAAKETRGLSEPILIPIDEEIQLNASFSGGGKSFNTDLGGDTILRVQIGNVRFRHGADDTAQVAFADGSVRSVKLNKRRTFGNDQFYFNEFKRSYLLTKAPSTAVYRSPP